MVVQWPPNVWHGVLDPQTGEPISPVKMRSKYEQEEKDSSFESIKASMQERDYEDIDVEKYMKNEK